MDAETARAVAQIAAQATLTGAVIGLVGALVVGLLAQVGQLILASRHASYERQKAREQEWRAELGKRVDYIVGIADTRMGLYKRAVIEASTPGADPGDTQRLWLATIHGEQDAMTNTSFMGIPDADFHKAVQAFMVTDRTAQRQVQQVVDRMIGRWGDATAKNDAIAEMEQYALTPLNDVLWKLHEEANAVVFSGRVKLPVPS
jgi:hypothetical protein